jgi:ribosomal protein L32
MKNIRLIDAITLKKKIVQNVNIDSDAVCDVLDIIDDAPTISERSQGEWEKTIYGFYTCSKCGNYGNPKFFNYCSNCGAYMRGDENNGK